MSWGEVRNSPSIGLIGGLSFGGGGAPSEPTVGGNLQTEANGNLLQENGSLILLET